MPRASQFKPHLSVDPVFEGRALCITASGEQSGVQEVILKQKLTRFLLERGCPALLCDLRDARYRSLNGVEERLASLAASFPPGRVAIWHQNEDGAALAVIVQGFSRAGHDTRAVTPLEAAQRHLCPPDTDPDTVYV